MFNIEQTEYNRIKREIYPFIERVSKHYNKPISHIRHYHISEYCENNMNVIIKYPKFNKLMVDGFADKVDDYFIISINDNAIRQRKTFTLMHEITHCLMHFKDNSRHFSSDIERNTQNELEANIGASLLLINDEALDECLYKGYSFNRMLNTFGCSKNALYTRLVNYFQYNFSIYNNLAKKLVYNYSKGNVKKFFETFNKCKTYERMLALQHEYERYII